LIVGGAVKAFVGIGVSASMVSFAYVGLLVMGLAVRRDGRSVRVGEVLGDSVGAKEKDG
jgi:hypothetical protein